MDRIWADVDEQVKALGASRLVIKTPASFSPSESNRAAIAEFMTRFAGTEVTPVWEPRGIWTQPEASAFAAEMGAAHAFDPFTETEFPTPPAGEAYYVLTGPFGRAEFSNDDLFDLVDFLGEHQNRVTCVFRGAARERNADALRKALKRA